MIYSKCVLTVNLEYSPLLSPVVPARNLYKISCRMGRFHFPSVLLRVPSWFLMKTRRNWFKAYIGARETSLVSEVMERQRRDARRAEADTRELNSFSSPCLGWCMKQSFSLLSHKMALWSSVSFSTTWAQMENPLWMWGFFQRGEGWTCLPLRPVLCCFFSVSASVSHPWCVHGLNISTKLSSICGWWENIFHLFLE